ncbi:D-aminoacyl-tRNA deacylase [Saccharophagus degradans]|uniref:D-aminoacyl-tRNA deacylase n=1 Tax=Saccharophagus degradans TaxID=86304 RepID=A0AAW7X387_9GAMM|nr:D-aminoacyl-tRNA deacylase [Saccharophagus degradans]MDO6422118.1 D-aminoacyl-tRNA deacylase [Saccharophagus degradans]MDO6609327.1 D-aminoacyl-tRNA deacylase [Saccharophagus degradans]WGO98025.1 D-aminoacyl-tRNA deacylase [Saccharophagus degradans]
MKVLIQRVSHASVVVEGQTIGAIDKGLLLFVGIEKTDSTETLERMVNKVLAYRVFSDDEGKMNLNVQQIGGGILSISQFTLAADTQKGLRPSFSCAAPPAEAQALYDKFVNLLKAKHSPIATGEFAADMKVSLLNDGPVTFMLTM